MPHSPRLLFILADGAHARFVTHEAEPDRFVTVRELDGAERLRTLRRELRASPPARSQESTSPLRHAVGREDYFRQAKEAFVAEVAASALRLKKRTPDGAVIVAPTRLVWPLRNHLNGKMRIAGVLTKDLIKTPDAELPRWLGSYAAGLPLGAP